MSDIPSIILLVDEDKSLVTYRPSLAKLTGSATAAILLQQVLYWWKRQGCKPFFKFKEPCAHKAYQHGDSWCEELAFSRSEFDTAIAKIGTKITQKKSKQAAYNWQLPRHSDFDDDADGYAAAFQIAVRHAVLFWTDGDHKTWFDLNIKTFAALLETAYPAKVEIPLQVDCEKSAKEGNLLQLDKAGFPLQLTKVEKPLYLFTETTQRLHREENTEDSLPKSLRSSAGDVLGEELDAPILDTDLNQKARADRLSVTPPDPKPEIKPDAVQITPTPSDAPPPSPFTLIHLASPGLFDIASPPITKANGDAANTPVPDAAPTSSQSSAPQAPEPSTKRATKTPYPAEIKDAFAILCYGTKDAWQMDANAKMMMKHLKQIPEAQRTLEKMRMFFCNWRKDFRGRDGRRPFPHEVISSWTVMTNLYCEDELLSGVPQSRGYEVVPLDDSYVAPGPAR